MQCLLRIERTQAVSWPWRWRLPEHRRPVRCALPRGGVPVAAKVAAALNAPFDLILVQKWRAGLARAGHGCRRGWRRAAGRAQRGYHSVRRHRQLELNAICDSELAEIERRRQRYLGSRERVEVAGRTAIVIDDGIATGATTRAALRATRMRKPKKLILAVPVAPTTSRPFPAMRRGGRSCMPQIRESSEAIGLYYSNFWSVPDDEVIELSRDFPRANRSSHPSPQPEGGGRNLRRSCCLPSRVNRRPR